jgi:membrane protein
MIVGGAMSNQGEPMTASDDVAHPPRPFWRTALTIASRSVVSFSEDRGTQLAAGVSYFALLSMVPIIIVTVSIFGLVLRNEGVKQDVLDGLIETLPITSVELERQINDLADGGPALTIVALLGLLWTASALSASIRNALEAAFRVERGRPLLQAKLVDYLVLAVVGLLFIASLYATASWQIIQNATIDRLQFLSGSLIWGLGALGISLALSFFTFLFLYWLVPNEEVEPLHALPGAIVAALGFEALKWGFGLYLSSINDFSLYGTLGAAIVLLFWVYLSANVFIYGAEIAAETGHALREEPRHGYAAYGDEGDWKQSLWNLIRGLALAPVAEGSDSSSNGSLRRRRTD